jgi:hypothetical protein
VRLPLPTPLPPKEELLIPEWALDNERQQSLHEAFNKHKRKEVCSAEELQMGKDFKNFNSLLNRYLKKQQTDSRPVKKQKTDSQPTN